MKKIYCVVCSKSLDLSVLCSKCGSKDWKILKGEPIKILQVLGLINTIEKYQKIWLKNFGWKE